ncbi:HDIG domain-containing metalloprotein [Sorangium sp. So ce367]|uniref:HDIG domain-containing metalloprotein n=1 Tax=Sorangium sp. So ce367 TaxID=3133305 RepID=UPI003F62CCFC
MLRTRIRAGPLAGFVLSALFAACFAVLGVGELFIPALSPEMGMPAPVTLRVPYGPRIVRDTHDGSFTLSYEHRRVIVPRGTVLSEHNEDHNAAMAYETVRRMRRPGLGARLASLYAIYLIVCLMLTVYLRRFGQNRVRLLRTQVGMFVLMTSSLIVAKLLLLFTALPEFWMPVAALPLWVAIAFDRRTAFLVEVGVAFIASSLLRFDVVLLSVLLVRGIAATMFFFKRKGSRQLFVAGSLAGIAGAIGFIALTVLFEGSFDLGADLKRWLGSNVLACVGGGLLVGVLGRSLREPAERAMGHVPRDKLLDLTDLEQPLLKKMAAEAPGSWEHARAMANLAEASAAAIGADALLTRVGAYYHDLGKTVQPKYFIENLPPGERSPHEELDPEVSADAIMAHVVMGTKILREGNIPEPVVEFAYTHHGTQVVEYFWHKCVEHGNPKDLTQEHFRYPGMKPQTKETAILMLVDSIEAASRTIWPPEHKKFEEMIQRVMFSKLASGQLDQSGLTIEDLRIMTSRMASTLVNMYHGRIKYPWQRESDRAGHTPAPPTVTPHPTRPGTPTPVPASSAPGRDGSAAPPPSSSARGAVPPSPASVRGAAPPPPASVRGAAPPPSSSARGAVAPVVVDEAGGPVKDESPAESVRTPRKTH